MNHIFKTVFNKQTMKTVVVSEKVSGNHQSQSGTNKNIESITQEASTLAAKRNSLAISIGLVLSTLCSANTFAITPYTGDLSTLTQSINISESFSQLIAGKNASGVYDNGITTLDTETTPIGIIQSDADITVNYSTGTTPDFILAGYSSVNLTTNPEIKKSVNNTVTLQQGNISGPLW